MPTLWPGRRSSATPRPTRATTSAVPTPRRRWRSSRGSPSAPRSGSRTSPTRGSTEIQPDDISYAKELGLSLKLLGVAERRDGGISVRVFPCFLYPRHPLAPVEGPFNAVMVEAPAITEITMSGPGAGGIETATAVLGDVVSIVSGGAPVHAARERSTIVRDINSAFYLHLEVADRPGVLARITEVLGRNEVSVRSVVQRGLGNDARLVMVMHEVPESRFFAALEEIATLEFLRAQPRAIRVIEEEFVLSAACRSSSATETACRLRTATRSSPSTRGRPRWSRRRSSQSAWAPTVYLKLEGANPTGSFKDRGMTVAVSRAKGAGAEAVICASTGNTAASAAAYAARAGMRGAVIVPEGKIAIGKLAQALMHGARVIALRGNFDQALEIVRELAQNHPIELVNSVNPLPDRGPEDRRVRGVRRARRAPGCAVDSGWQRGQHHLLVAGVPGVRGRARPLWLPGRGSGAAGARRAGGRAGDDRLGDPDRQPGALGGGDGRRHRLARAHRGRLRRSDPRRVPPARVPRGRLLRAGLGRVRGGPTRPRAPGAEGGEPPETVVCVLTGHGLKDPDTALGKAPAVIGCEPDAAAVERLVFD